MALSTHDDFMVYGDLSYYELVPISLLNTTSKIYSTHMFGNVILSLWFKVITQKTYLLKRWNSTLVMKTHLELGLSS